MIGVLRKRAAAAPDFLLRGRPLALAPQRIIGSGGEADIYDIGGGLAVKLFKRPDHPDYAGSRAAQQLARARLDEHQHKLPQLAALRLPDRVIMPDELVIDASTREIAGYAMPLVHGEPLIRYTDRGFLQNIDDDRVLAILRDLHATVAALHRAGVVIGDFNDLNVIVSNERAMIIDADSFQFASFRGAMFTQRFLDPLLTDGVTFAPSRPHNAESDWYAFAVMTMQLLLFVEPYGGVHPRMTRDQRALQRVTIFHRDVRVPKHAVSMNALPASLRDYFERTFVQDERGPFPLALLAPMQPIVVAAPAPPKPVVVVRGRVTATTVAALPSPPYAPHRFWIAGDQLMRDGRAGEEVVGHVLEGVTRFWVGTRFGFGFYGAGACVVAFVFDTAARGINDTVPLPPFGGQLVDVTCAFTDERCWLLFTVSIAGRLSHRCVVVRRDGMIEATGIVPRVHGNAAFGSYLFAATDDGIIRLEISGTQIVEGAKYPDTEPFVDDATRLILGTAGIYAVNGDGITLLAIA